MATSSPGRSRCVGRPKGARVVAAVCAPRAAIARRRSSPAYTPVPSPTKNQQDIVTRYASATGHYVSRRFGWDCHGLPVEYEIDKKLGIKGRDDVLKMGIAQYNDECRAIVMRYSGEWARTVRRLGRWIDFENDYKTLDTSYMESVWWVFKQLHEKGLVYRGFKVMPFSTACSTPLSNFEAGLNYKDVQDPAVTVRGL